MLRITIPAFKILGILKAIYSNSSAGSFWFGLLADLFFKKFKSRNHASHSA
jgi:hypothetical protein